VDYIKTILKKDEPSIEELINCFEEVKRNGNIAVIKFDGERNKKEYTIFISFTLTKNREMIRADENNLREGLLKVLRQYIETN
jgi:hypothetical protein